MELDTITIDRTEARRRFLEYRRAIRDRRHEQLREEDEQIMRAYREAAKGAQLIRLTDVLRAGGTQTTEVAETRWIPASQGGPRHERTGRMLTAQLPKLAIARADVEQVYCRGIDHDGGLRFTYERGSQHEMVAMAPTIPPALRPAHHLRNYHLLWEAEWKKPNRPAPPVDPALLHHVGGDLYAVLAVWDLTDLERAVLAGTRA